MIVRFVCTKCSCTEPDIDKGEGLKCLDCSSVMTTEEVINPVAVLEIVDKKEYRRKTCKAFKCSETPINGINYCFDHKSRKGMKTEKGKYDTRKVNDGK